MADDAILDHLCKKFSVNKKTAQKYLEEFRS